MGNQTRRVQRERKAADLRKAEGGWTAEGTNPLGVRGLFLSCTARIKDGHYRNDNEENGEAKRMRGEGEGTARNYCS